MSKFENIKVGDSVLIPIESPGLLSTRKRRFLISNTVVRVTKTQFTAGGSRFLKSSGIRIGDSRAYVFAELPGGEMRTTGKLVIAKDQTQEMEAFKKQIKILKEILNSAEQIANFLTRNAESAPDMFDLEDLESAAAQMRAVVNVDLKLKEKNV